MARCGCSSATCACSVTAGDGVTVTGAGSAANPYVISSEGASLQVTDTPTVDLTLTGAGTIVSPYQLSAAAKISAVAGNVVTAQADGLAVTCATIAATCGPVPIVTADTTTVDLSGNGTAGTPLSADVIIDPEATNLLVATGAGLDVPCEAVQDCVGQGFAQGLLYDDGANLFVARIDPAPGNNLVQSPTGLFVPSGAATVSVADTPCVNMGGDGSGGSPLMAFPIIDPAAGNMLTCEPGGFRADLSVGCGVSGDGTPASPLIAAVSGTFAGLGLACPDTSGDIVYCSAAGTLRVPPPRLSTKGEATRTVTVSRPVTGPQTDTELAVVTATLINPDPCRPMTFAVTYRYNWTVDGASASHWRFRRAISPPGGGAPGAPITVIQLQTPAAAPLQITQSDVRPTVYTVPAGGSIGIQLNLEIIVDSGTGTIIQYASQINWIGVSDG